METKRMHRINYSDISNAFFVLDGDNYYGEFQTALDLEVFLCDQQITKWTMTVPAMRKLLEMGVRYVHSN